MLRSLLSCAWLRSPSSAQVCFWLCGWLPLPFGGAVLQGHIPCPAWVAPTEGHQWTPHSVLCWRSSPRESKAEQAAAQETFKMLLLMALNEFHVLPWNFPLIAEMLLEFLLEARGQYLNSSKKKQKTKKNPTLIACSGHFAAKITSFACSIYDWETTTAVCCAWVTQRWGDTESIRNAA